MIRNMLIPRELTDVANRMPELTSSGWWDENDTRTCPRAKLSAVQEAKTAKQRMHQRRTFGHTEAQTDARSWCRRKVHSVNDQGSRWCCLNRGHCPASGWPAKTLPSIVELPVQTRHFSYSFPGIKQTETEMERSQSPVLIVIELDYNLQEKNVLHKPWRSYWPCSLFCISAV